VYQIDFYVTKAGKKPALDWLDALSLAKQLAMAAAIKHYLIELGPDICKTKMGERVGDGIVEFKVWRKEDQILAHVGEPSSGEPAPPEKILLRLFVHFYGDHRILLIDGYDKAVEGAKRQQPALTAAKRMLGDHERRMRQGGRR
jgi:hypothetical protein